MRDCAIDFGVCETSEELSRTMRMGCADASCRVPTSGGN